MPAFADREDQSPQMLRDDLFLATVNESVALTQVTANDMVSGEPIEFSRPSNGRVRRDNSSGGQFFYVPQPGFTGVDEFSYRMKTTEGVQSARVKIVVSEDIEATNWQEVAAASRGIQLGSSRRFAVQSLAVFGPNARTLALLDREDGKGIHREIENELSPYVPELHGSVLAAATVGRGRLVLVPNASVLRIPSFLPPAEDGAGDTNRLLRTTIDWLSQSREANNRRPKIVTIHDGVANALDGQMNHRNTKVVNDPDSEGLGYEVVRAFTSDGKAQFPVKIEETKLIQALKDADVFIGSIGTGDGNDSKRTLGDECVSSPAVMQALHEFVSRGGGLWLSASESELINPLIRDAGLCLGSGTARGDLPLTDNVPTQWSREFDDIFDALDVYAGVYGRYLGLYGDSDTSKIDGHLSPSYVPESGSDEDPIISAASLVRAHLWTMAEGLPIHDTLRADFSKHLPQLNRAEVPHIKHIPEIRDLMAVALAKLESEDARHAPMNALWKSRIVDQLLGGAVPDDTPRLRDHVVELLWQNYDLQPLGLHAVPGEVVEIDFSQAMQFVDKGFSIFINPKMEVQGSVQDPALNQPVDFHRAFPITSDALKDGKLVVGSAYGGALFFANDAKEKVGSASEQAIVAENFKGEGLAPPRKFYETEQQFAARRGLEDVASSLPIRVSGGSVQMPHFKLGTHTNEDWDEIKYRPGYFTVLEIPHGRYYWILPTRELHLWDVQNIEVVMARMWISVEQVMKPMGMDQGIVRFPYSASMLYVDRPGGESINPTNSMLGMKLGCDRCQNHLFTLHGGTDRPINYHKVGHVFEGIPGICPLGNERAVHQYTDWLKNGVVDAMGDNKKRWVETPWDQYKSVPGMRDGKRGIKPHGFLNILSWAPYGDQDGVEVWRHVNAGLVTDYLVTYDGDPQTMPKLPVVSSTTENPLNPEVANRYIQHFYDQSGYDVTPIFRTAGFAVSPSTIQRMAKAPKWAPLTSKYYKSPAVMTSLNQPVTLDLQADTAYLSVLQKGQQLSTDPTFTSFGGVRIKDGFEFKTFRQACAALDRVDTKSKHGGTVDEREPGVFQYTPKQGFIGRDYFSYSVSHPEIGNSTTFTVCVMVGPEVHRSRSIDEMIDYPRRGFYVQKVYNEDHPAEEYIAEVNSIIRLRRYDYASVLARGYLEITPELEGTYTFWLSSTMPGATVKLAHAGDTTDSSQAETIIEVSREFDPAIRNSHGYFGIDRYHRQWRKQNTSTPVTLKANADGSPRRYYIEIHKPGGSRLLGKKSPQVSDKPGLSLGWSKGPTDGADMPEQIVSSRHIIPFTVPRGPQPQPDLAKTRGTQPVKIQVLSNDRDYGSPNINDTSSLTVFSVVGSGKGKIEIVDDGKAVLYTPSPGFSGTDHLWYIAKYRDGRKGDPLAVARVDVTVE